MLGSLFLLESENTYGKAVLVDAVKRSIRKAHEQGKILVLVGIESLAEVQVHSVHHRNGFLAVFRSGVYEYGGSRLVT